MKGSLAESFDLSGKVALVTGGAGWLGTAMCEGLAQAGATVALVDVDGDAAQAAAAKLQEQELSVEPFAGDMLNDGPLQQCITEVAQRLGRLDVLVNGAYTGPTPPLDEATFADYEKGLAMGPAAYGAAAREAVTHMRQVGGGSIINIGSMYGVVTGYPRAYEGLCNPNSIVYQSGKAAIIHMTRHMAVYWAADNIRVNCVSPGPFPPPRVQEASPDFIKRLNAESPLGRIGQPHEMKGAVVFLASAAAGYVTGQNIMVDGGWTIW